MSNLTTRILTAVVAIPVIILITLSGGVFFLGFVVLLSALALREFYDMSIAKGAQPQKIGGLIAGVGINLAFFHSSLQTWIVGWCESFGVRIPFPSQSQLLLIIVLLSVVVISLRELFRNNGSAINNLSTTFFGIFYVSLFFGTWIGIRELFTITDPVVSHFYLVRLGVSDGAQIYSSGGYMVLSIFVMIWICDSAAFHFGKLWGRHKLFPRVSPNKSWEGAIAGFLFALGAALATRYFVAQYLTMADALVIGVIVGFFGQLGDLLESLLKRDARVKDSSSLIPGHGGVLDRFDSLLFVSPLVYLYLDFILFS